MNFLKQYLITLTFIVIAVWVMPANTQREILSTLCTALYETGRLSKQYRDIPIQTALEGVIIRMGEAGLAYRLIKPGVQVPVQVPAELQVKQAALQSIICDGAKKRHEENEASKLKGTESLLKDILNNIAKEANNTDITDLNDKIKTKEDLDKALRNLTVHFSNFIKKSIAKKEILCPLIDDFCNAETESPKYTDFYKSIFNINVEAIMI